MKILPTASDIWEIRKGGKIWVRSPAANCGYDEKTLAGMRKRGYRLYKNGKPAQKEPPSDVENRRRQVG